MLTQRNVLLGVCLLAFLTSCKEVAFKTPQPKGIESLRSIPTDLHGAWISTEEDPGTDTLVIGSQGYKFTHSKDKDWLGGASLSDSLVLKSYQGYYFVSFLSDGEWVLRVLRINQKGNMDFMAVVVNNDETEEQKLKELAKYARYRKIKKKDAVYYRINPTADQLVKMIEGGLFTSTELRKLP